MKKIYLLLMFFGLIFVACGCDPIPDPHQHSYSEKVVEATCEEKGYTEFTCECGDTYKDLYVDALGHKYGEWVVVKEATIDEAGLKERVCSCGDKEEEIIPQLSHVHNYKSNTIEPTCTDEGYTEYTCECGHSYKDFFEDPIPHTFGQWVVIEEATEEKEGLMERTCVCGEKETKVLDKLVHIHKYGEWTILKEATEEEEGSRERICACGEKQTEVINKLPHVHVYGDWVTITEPTQTAEGEKERTCKCGKKETAAIPMLGGQVVITVGEGKQYTSLDEAIKNAPEGARIVLDAGEYKLSAIIDKSLQIYGPNANLDAPANVNDEALINVDKDISGNLAANTIEFNGVHLKGTGGGAGIPGITFQDGGNIEKLIFKSCEISDTNTFLKFVGGDSSLELTFSDCHIHTIGQFILWTTTAINKTVITENIIEGSTCGAVTNANAALFRIRCGSLEAYNNVFNGSSMNLPGYFECSAKESFVKYNTFNNVIYYVFTTASNKVVFDENIYLDGAGKALDAAPKEVKGTGVTADKKVLKTAEEANAAYLNYLLTAYPNRYFNVTFELDGGTITSTYPVVYDSEMGIAMLPTIERDGFIFDGWYLDSNKIECVEKGTTGNLTIKAQWVEDALIVDGTSENGHYATLADALAVAKDGDVIKLMAGEYTGDAKIDIPNITIKGPNAGVDAVNGQRNAEAIYKGVITVTSKALGLTIDGLSFTGSAKIKYDESVNYTGFVFKNNKVYDTTESAKTWDESRYALPGFIQFTMASGGIFKDVEIYNNSFVNVSEVNVLANRVVNLIVDGNLFKDFDLDAIRTEGGYAYGVLAFTNNVFEQTTAESGNNGIFLYSVAGSAGSKAYVLIENNSFIKLGKNNGTVFTGAISGYRFQENYTKIEIKNNIFDHCYDYIYLRNNGGNSDIWFCTVENNQFLGLPNNQYFGTYRGSDSESTNPHLAVFKANYYEDNNGAVIADLTTIASYFKHLSTYGTALNAKPGAIETKPVEIWSISYETNDGKTSDSYIYEYNSYIREVIILPVLTKANHKFNGWLLNGELVTEIAIDVTGDLDLVADFSVLEGEIYQVEFVENKENVIWPSRPASNREEIIEELFKDLYEWAVGNGETKDYDAYVNHIKTLLSAYEDISLRNTSLGNYPAEDGSTAYFLNVPKYYQKWNEFFALFDKAMLAVNSDQSFYKDTYATMVRMHQFIAWTSTGQGYFQSYLPKMCAVTKVPAEIPTSYRGGQEVVLPKLELANGLQFLGWFGNPEFTGEAIEKISATDSGNKKFYAKWAAEVLVESVEINKISELLLFKTHQLVWTINPSDATNKEIEFFSSNEKVATINSLGLITALAKGKTVITVKVYGNRAIDFTFEVEVYTDDYIEGSYETESFAVVGNSLQLNALVNYKDNTTGAVKWTSLTPEIATVDENGLVDTLKAGIAKIIAVDPKNENLKLEFEITVLGEDPSEILEFIINNHESNIFTKLNLGIGAGTPSYYMDILGSVSKILMGDLLSIDDSRKDMEVTNNTGDYFNEMKSIEFITVHYTGNMSKGAHAKANANYFVGKNSVSIHYTTGNDGVYQCLTHDKGAYHAGDSGAYDVVGEFKWIPTGIQVGTDDPLYPVFTISNDFYYEINGQKTSVPMPKPWNYSNRGTDHTLNSDGTISSKAGFGGTAFANRTPESFINDMSLPFTIIDGQYYMGTTWWAYTQVYEGRICSTGGNRNSIGIESCVDEGSDLWYTWQKTAQLVAKLMKENNLDITRVRGHHFFTAKDCPQPMLENDLEIWWEFIELVEAEYELLTEYQGYEIKFESHNPDILDNNGRIIKQPDETTTVSYTITITNDGNTESITLSSIVQGKYVDR